MDESAWHKRMICTSCGWNKYAPHGSLFHASNGLSGVCPECGVMIQEHRLAPEWGKPFILKTSRWISESIWYKPSTWGTGHWEYKQ